MPRWLQITLCFAIFTIVMLALKAFLHATVPGALRWADATLGQNTVAGIMIAVFLACAYIGWGPLIRARLAKRRGGAVGQREQAPGEEFGVRRPDRRFRERP